MKMYHFVNIILKNLSIGVLYILLGVYTNQSFDFDKWQFPWNFLYYLLYTLVTFS